MTGWNLSPSTESAERRATEAWLYSAGAASNVVMSIWKDKGTAMWFELQGDERITERCASDGCGGQPTWRLEKDGCGSDYCSGCKAKIDASTNELRAILGEALANTSPAKA